MYSVIIPTHKRNTSLYQCLDCLYEYFDPAKSERRTFQVEVIVSDDAKDGELKQHLATHYPWVRYFAGPSRGAASNRNNGVAHAKGDWLAFTDDDCLPSPGWLEVYHANTARANVLEGKTTADRPRERLDEEAPINNGGYLWSCNFAISKALFDSMGGFDENIPPASMEDVDLKTRLDIAGEKVLYLPEALVIHPWRRIPGLAVIARKQRSELFFWKKHPTLAPPSMPRYYAYLGIRSLLKITLPGALKFRGRGLKTAISYDAWHLFQALRFLAIKTSPPSDGATFSSAPSRQRDAHSPRP